VHLLTKGSLEATNSYQAQGGVAAALADDDSQDLHAADTLAAGRGLCRESAVRLLTAEVPARIRELEQLEVAFDTDLAREGGHSRRRIVHAGGAETGRRIAETLAARAQEERRITISEDERALTVWQEDGRCCGVVGERGPLRARATLLATGGYAALWRRTTNPPGAVGDGLLLAYRAGARLADLELVQFHPTALLDDGFLLSEALRGDGALLLDGSGSRFTDELAPRDVVARAIAARHGVRLDLRPVDRSRYPSLVATLERAGYDPASEPVPVAPAAHYTVGGIVTDLEGRTHLAGLFAAGECACTGVHGANRLASNSLLECLVFGRRAALAGLDEPAPPRANRAPAPPVAFDSVRSETARELWHALGLTRERSALERLLDSPHPLVRLAAAAAIARCESRGVHFRTDNPSEDEHFAGRHIVHERGRDQWSERWS